MTGLITALGETKQIKKAYLDDFEFKEDEDYNGEIRTVLQEFFNRNTNV